MPYLVCYDITKNSLRTRMSKKILSYGLDRINKSVYLGTINKSALATLAKWLQQEVSQKGDPTDSCLILPVTAEQIHRMQIIGLNELDKAELSGEKSTLIL